jgi:tRNA nucleotidyltransferase (CCA-adding enzyme)
MVPADSRLEQAQAIARAARDRGARALVVGGWVRDRLLGKGSKDLDLEIFGISGSELADFLAPFGRIEAVGQSFPVYKVEDIDVALPRRESKAGRGHKAF